MPPGAQTKAQFDLHVYLQEMPQLVFQSVIRPGKFLKTVVCKSVEQGACIVKVYRKPGEGVNPDLEAELAIIGERLHNLRQRLTLVEVCVHAGPLLSRTCHRRPCCRGDFVVYCVSSRAVARRAV